MILTMTVGVAHADWNDGQWIETQNGCDLYFNVNMENHTAALMGVTTTSQDTSLHLIVPSQIIVTEEYEGNDGETHTRNVSCTVIAVEIGISYEQYESGSDYSLYYNGNWYVYVSAITIPSTVTHFRSNLFIGSFYYNGSMSQWLSMDWYGNRNYEDTTWFETYDIEDLHTEGSKLGIVRNLYIGGNLITNLTIPEGVMAIPPQCFSGAIGITSVVLPNSVTYIGTLAFGGCINLQHVTIGPNVDAIGIENYSHDYWGNTFPERTIRNVHFTGSIDQWNARNWGTGSGLLDGYRDYDTNGWEQDYGYNLYIGGTLLTDCVIPSTIDTLYRDAFANCGSIISVTLPSTLHACHCEAFKDCRNITSLTLPKYTMPLLFDRYDSGHSYYDAVNDTLYGIFSVLELNEVYYNGNVEEWIQNKWYKRFYSSLTFSLFLDGTRLDNLIIPSTIDTVPDFSFRSCGIRNLTVPEHVTYIGNQAFLECRQLEGEVSIQNANIGQGAFAFCSKISSVVIGDGVEVIGQAAFSRDSLSALHLGAGLDSIGPQAFACYLPERVVSTATHPARLGIYGIYDIYTSYNNSNAWRYFSCPTLQVPCGSYDEYANSLWGEYFKSITELEYQLIVDVAPTTFSGVTFLAGTVEIQHGATCSSPQATIKAQGRTIEGYSFRFDHWSDGSTENPYTFTLTSDTTMKAYFVQGSESISHVDAKNVNVYVQNSCVMLSEPLDTDTYIYDIMGRKVGVLRMGQTKSSSLQAGVYIVNTGTMSVKCVVTR